MKRAQAALEFLTTYGWMFLIVLAVFGAFSYFGFSNVRSSIPESCTFLEAFRCDAMHALDNGRFGFQFANEVGRSVNITAVVCEFPDEPSRLKYEYSPHIVLASGEQMTVHCDGPLVGSLDYNDVTRYEVQVAYILTYDDAPLPKIARGDIVVDVSEDTVLMDTYEANQAAFSSQVVV